MSREFYKFSDLIGENLLGTNANFFKLVKFWTYIVGKELKDKLFIKKLENKILFITVPDSGWLQTLSYQKQALLNKVKEVYPEVRDIRFSVEKNKIIDLTNEPTVDLSSIKLDDKILEKIEKDLEKVKDENLRKRLRSLYVKKEKFKKYAKAHGILDKNDL